MPGVLVCSHVSYQRRQFHDPITTRKQAESSRGSLSRELSTGVSSLRVAANEGHAEAGAVESVGLEILCY